MPPDASDGPIDERIPPRDKVSVVTEGWPEPFGWTVGVTIRLLEADKTNENQAMVWALQGVARRLKSLGYDPIAILRDTPLTWGGAPDDATTDL